VTDQEKEQDPSYYLEQLRKNPLTILPRIFTRMDNLIEENESLLRERDILYERCERLKREMREGAVKLQCKRYPAYAERGQHEPDCKQYVADKLLAAIEE
jgi:hypothetical protein